MFAVSLSCILNSGILNRYFSSSLSIPACLILCCNLRRKCSSKYTYDAPLHAIYIAKSCTPVEG